MASTHRFVVTGAPNPGWPQGSAPPQRLNVVDFVKDKRMFSLYVQALQEMYDASQDDVRSYYRIGGIHGLPYEPWNDDPNKTPLGSFGGYCTHATSIFPTWHRPYVLAFEQVLQDHAAKIAEEYTTETSEWRKAAAELRQPFWDWAAPGQAVPPDEVIRLSKVYIRAKPDGKETEVENPLYAYKFKFKIPGSGPPVDGWPTTVRHPKDDKPESHPDDLARVLLANQESLTTQTFFMFTLLSAWPEFSNTRAVAAGNPATSLEGIHNSVHNFTGGGGHMSRVPVAGFDPIFYMHHANVDRQLSLWAALHPGVWVTEDKEVSGTFALPDDAPVDGNTSLFPFPNTQDTYWTSNNSADTTPLGYTYPEFDGLNMNDPIGVKKAISEIVSKLYSSSHLSAFPSVRQPAIAAASEATTTISDTRNSLWEWSARVRVKALELERSFHVLIFLGNVPEDSNEWATAPSYVGSFGAFVNEAAAQCANCQAHLDAVTEGYVHLGNAITRHSTGTDHPFDPDRVKPYLKDSLNWRVQMAHGTPVPLESLPSLEVTVVAAQITFQLEDLCITTTLPPVA
ncbi:hypothetical protein GSI_15435 [Ganoderma sinense ZZ0214-1]|uniref:tyrosinase n=1 Tax=Ganoderma sinense ZZ0214-1 TaxID=1077348 RepID=A0A2G8RMK1_9APHY|nr:hypothetical protein GSI_15435 [Ganoderma sinense ZZ0214-1]